MKFNSSFLMISVLIPFFFAAHECHVISRRDADERAQKTEKGDSMSPKFDLSKQKNFEGDNILPGKKPIGGIERSAVNDKVLLWSEAKIPYVISNDFTQDQVQTIWNVMNIYESKTCIKFIPRTIEMDYIEINKTGKGCSSGVGNKGKIQTVSLDDSCFSPHTIKHELMHAAGFWHEMSRTDRDKYLIIYKDNIEAGKEFNFDKYDQKKVQSLDTGYDLKSIMQYSWNSFAKDTTKATMTDKSGKNFWSSDDFTLTDLLDLNRLYQCHQKLGSHYVKWDSFEVNNVPFMWGNNCDVTGNNIEVSTQKSYENCVVRCAQNFDCTIFTFHYSTLSCTLKSGPVKGEGVSPQTQELEGTVCGYISDGNSYFQWQESAWPKNQLLKWAPFCDFPGNDIRNVINQDNNCERFCLDEPTCTSYAVRADPGSEVQKCYLKSGKSPFAVYEGNVFARCGMFTRK